MATTEKAFWFTIWAAVAVCALAVAAIFAAMAFKTTAIILGA